MSRKPISVCLATAVLVSSGWVGSVATTTLALGGMAALAGCSSDRSEARQDARTEARTSERAEQRVEDRND